MTPVERRSGICVWRQIASYLIDRIADGEYPPDARLPTEPILAELFKVNRHTVRRAIGELRNAGLIRIEQGRGTYVQSAGIRRRSHTDVPTFLDDIPFEATFQDVSHVNLRDASVAQALGLSRRATLICVRGTLNFLDGSQAKSELFLEQKRFSGFHRSLASARYLAAAYRDYQVKSWGRAWSRILVAVGHAQADCAAAPSDARAVLRAESLYVDGESTPLHYEVIQLSLGERVCLELDGPSSAREPRPRGRNGPSADFPRLAPVSLISNS